jgi:GNAT superfamily N-acetyltransferase
MRGQGISRLMLKELESLARRRGFRVLRAETGTRQPEAMKLCETSGYHRIECFGEYAGDPFSVCYERILE